jgi:hypothetical protein
MLCISGVFVLVYLQLVLLRFVLKMPRPIAMLTSTPPQRSSMLVSSLDVDSALKRSPISPFFRSLSLIPTLLAPSLVTAVAPLCSPPALQLLAFLCVITCWEMMRWVRFPRWCSKTV